MTNQKPIKLLMSRSVYLKTFDKGTDSRKAILDVVERYTGDQYRVTSFELTERFTDQLNADNTNDDYYHMGKFEKIAERRYNKPTEIIAEVVA